MQQTDVGGWGEIDLPHQVRGGGPEGWTLFLSFKVENQTVYNCTYNHTFMVFEVYMKPGRY